MGRYLKSFEVDVRKCIDSTEETVGRNMNIEGNSVNDSERKEESYRESFYNHKQNVGRNMNVKSSSIEVSGRHEEHIKTRGKNILAIKWPRTWPNCVSMFCGE